jgi:3-phosphoshikimate 1-carboxyvinyltransferase
MKNIEITPKKLKGTLEIPPSKSVSHRAIISAGLAKGESIISNVLLSEDMWATCKAVEAFGGIIRYEEEKNHRYTLRIKGTDEVKLRTDEVECNESGSTLRFIIPILLLQDQPVTVKGKGRLVTRPMTPYYDIFKEKKINYQHLINGQDLPLLLKGKLLPGNYALKGSVSSQFITGLLFALPLLVEDSVIEITTPLESKPYIDITIEMLKNFGVSIINDDYHCFYIKGNQQYQSCDYRVDGDFSQAAFWLVAGSIGEEIHCLDLDLNSKQGDQVIVDLIKKMGGKIKIQPNEITIMNKKTHGIEIDVSQCPDLVPILGVLGSLSSGTTRIINGERLRYKESDRIMATADVLNILGAKITETKDGLIIQGINNFSGGMVKSHNDHRIAMAVAMASIASDGKIILEDAQVVKKSYPHFWEDFKTMGGEIHGVNMGKSI